MIKLTKGPKPQILVDKAEEWKSEYQGHIDAGMRRGDIPNTVKFRYRHTEVKAAIKADSYEKCIYCESKITHVSPGQTDHILPVSQRPDLIVDWDNLVFVCEVCNRNKSDYYDENLPLLNPYVDDPDMHLRYFGPLVLHAPNDSRGYLTRWKIGLDRAALIERRKERLENLQSLVDKWASLQPGHLKEIVKQQLLQETGVGKEFSATAKHFLRQQGIE